MVQIRIPSQLSSLANGQKVMAFAADHLAELFAKVDETAPMLRSQLFEPSGVTRQFVTLFVDGKQVRRVDPAVTLRDQSEVVVVMAVAGG